MIQVEKIIFPFYNKAIKLVDQSENLSNLGWRKSVALDLISSLGEVGVVILGGDVYIKQGNHYKQANCLQLHLSVSR